MAYTDILNEREGFGRSTTGGADGSVVIASDLALLTSYLGMSTPLWIRFPAGVTIDFVLPDTVAWGSDKTLDGRGADVNIRTVNHDKKLFTWQGIHNVIMLNVSLNDGWPDWQTDNEGSDGLNIVDTNYFWVHHCTFKQWRDGAIDMRGGAANGSVTWSRFEKTYQALNWTGDNLSFGNNYVKDVGARALQVIGGKAHSYNNYIANWKKETIQNAKDGAQLLSDSNIWEPGGFNKVNARKNGGKIGMKGNVQLRTTTFIGNDSISSSFTSAARASANVLSFPTVPQAKAYRDKLNTKCGPTLPAVA